MVEALIQQGNSYAERPETFRDISRFDNQEGMFAAYGAPRIKIRRFTMQTLRDFGMGKSFLEPKITDEIHCIIKEIKKSSGKPVFIKDSLAKSVVNVLCAMMFGKRMDYEDNNFQQLILLAREYLDSIKINKVSLYVPQFLLQLFGNKTVLYRGTLLYRKIFEEVKKFKFDATNNEESFIDVWKNKAAKPNANSEIFNEKKLVQILAELFIAGSGSTSTTLEWALLYLIKHPQVQKKVQMEIDDVIGRDRDPSMSDQKLMPYTESTILEVTRIVTIAPLAAPHRTTEDTMLRSYFIPKNTTILLNLSALHMDPEVFPEPEVFKPERFLTEDNKVKRILEMNPFSLGLFSAYGAPRIAMRRFTLHTLRNFGMGKSILEPQIMSEINYMLEDMKKFEGKPVDLHELLIKSTTNVLCAIKYGKRMDYDDKNFQHLLHLSRDYIASIHVNQLSAHLPKFLTKLLGFQSLAYKGTLLYKKVFDEVKKCQNNSSNIPESFIDVWRAEADKPNANSDIFNDQRLAQVLTELILAGSDSASTTLQWALLYLIKYPEVQKKVQMEIDDVIGRDRYPSMSDQKLMPYTESTLLETTRIVTIAPLAAPHSVTEDTMINGYFIPKNSTVFPNLWGIHMDPEVFPEPEKFKPERFITTDNKVKKTPELNPFGLG
uniref:Cytochrome P450 n=1 Tax=Strigamia maritima TaxID=126957 RepID=T1IK16_STRMM